MRGRPAAECGAGRQKPMDGTAFAAGQRLKTGISSDGGESRAAAVAALVRQEQDGFSNLVLDAELKRQQLEGRDKALPAPSLHGAGTPGHAGLHPVPVPAQGPCQAGCAGARNIACGAGAGPLYASAGVRCGERSRQADPCLQKIQRIRSGQRRAAQGVQLRPEHRKLQNEVERLMVLGSAGRDVAEFLHKTTRTKHWISLPTRPTAA